MTGDDDLDLGSMQLVTHAAVMSTLGQVFQRVALYAANLLLARGLGIGPYGVFALGQRITLLFGTFTPAGVGQTLQRFVPAYQDEPGRRDRIVGLAYGSALVASLAFAAAMYLWAPALNARTIDHPLFVPALRAFAVLLPLNVLLSVTASLFRSLELPGDAVLLANVASPLTLLVGAGGALLLGSSVIGVVAGWILATAVALTGAALLAGRRVDARPTLRGSRAEAATFYDHAVPNTLSMLGRVLRLRVDVLLVGFLLSSEAAGIYNVALVLTAFITIPLLSFVQLVPPVAARLYADGETGAVDALYAASTRWILTGALLIATVEVVYYPELLGTFGAEFRQGGAVVLLFVAGQLVNAAAGPVGLLLMMTDHQYLNAVDNWVIAVLNVGLSYLFILEFGLVGAALGTVSSFLLMNTAQVLQLWHLEGFFPLSWRTLKPVGASAGMAATMYAVDAAVALSRAALLVVGPLAGAAAFFALLLAFGVEPVDRELLGALSDQYRSALAPGR